MSSESEETMSGFARSKDGDVVHRASCRHARIPWRWADNKPLWVVAQVVRSTGWLRECGICKPLEEVDRV